MTKELWERLKRLYYDALKKPESERAHFVAEVCGDDRELREALEGLLAKHSDQTDTLDKPIVDVHCLSPDEAALRPGDVLLDRFRIVRFIDGGGMGEVYEAVDLLFDPGRIALKTIKPALAQVPGALARFKEEVSVAQQVGGPNVCRIREFYLNPKEMASRCPAFLTMEYLDGKTLAATIKEEGPLPITKALEIAMQLCEALHVIHSEKVIHRDLKPKNIMLVPRGEREDVVVMDFGLAHTLPSDVANAETGITMPGEIAGTPDYMAPEQFDAGGKITAATDIYALGVVLYEMVTGRRPFAAPTLYSSAVLRGRRLEAPSFLRREVSAEWDDVIAKCLEYDVGHRYRSAREVATALKKHRWVFVRFRNGLRISFTRRSALAACAGIAAALLCTGAMVAYWITRPPPPSDEVLGLYHQGIAEIRSGTYLKATADLGMAVKLDSKFSLAHARLAEAWSELDFTGPAQSEMLLASAPDQQYEVADLDRKYIDAVRNTLVRDYSAAAQDYEDILKKLPDSQKADGYVDLGRAYEKAGRISETIASYKKAAQLRPYDPAPFVHLGIWESRQRNPAAAEAAFQHAEELYQANPEGLAEVAYQRGYAANEAADSEHARQYLEKSLAIARQIPSVQLEVRSLTQLSSVEYNDNRDDKAIEEANQAIQLARDHGLEYWVIDGLMRLGNAYLDKEDFPNAELYSQQALHLATQTQHPRIVADAEFTLASIRDQHDGNPDEEIAFAQEALKYYRDYGFMNEAADSSILIVRSEEAKGNYEAAVSHGAELVRLAEKTHSRMSMENAQEALGFAELGLENYPEALVRFENALQISHEIHQNEAYQEAHCSDTLWRLGQFGSAEQLLLSIPTSAIKRADLGIITRDIRARMRLSNREYRQALIISKKTLQGFPDMPASESIDLRIVEAVSESALGETKQAQRDTGQLINFARLQSNEENMAYAQLAGAELSLQFARPADATVLATAANQYFSEKGKRESEWISLFYLAMAAKTAGDIPVSKKKAAEAIDILRSLEQSWGSQVFHQYSTRADLKAYVTQLTKLSTE